MTPKATTAAVASIASLAVIAVVDYATGYEFRMDVFYFLPVSFMAWAAGRRAGILMSMLAATMWGAVDWLDGHAYAREIYRAWNGFTVFLGAIAMALLLDRLHRSLDHVRRMAEMFLAQSPGVKEADIEVLASATRAWMRKMRHDG